MKEKERLQLIKWCDTDPEIPANKTYLQTWKDMQKGFKEHLRGFTNGGRD